MPTLNDSTESPLGFDAPKVVCFSDTYGAVANNGVGRFLDDALSFARADKLPFRLVVPGKTESHSDVLNIRAPSFSPPIYSKVSLSIPLEAHRRMLRRRLSEWGTEIIHVSTPGPFGLLGLSLAQQLKIPTIGIYHTDFPRYARELVLSHFNDVQAGLSSSVRPLLLKGLPYISPLLDELELANPDFQSDVAVLTEVLLRNYKALVARRDPIDVSAELAQGITRQLLSNFYRRFTMVLARSTSQQMELGRELGLDPEKIRLLPPGTDHERFSPSKFRRELIGECDFPSNAFILLYVGRVTAEKNVALLRDIWSKLLDTKDLSTDHFRLLVAGYGDEAEIKRLRQLPQVQFLGPIEGHRLSEVYASSDLLLFPSTTETLGQVGLEAMSSGTPVLASNQGGQVSYVRNEHSGVLLPPNETGPWIDTILRLSKDPKSLEQMSRNARDDVERRYSIAGSLASYWKLHAEAVGIAALEKRIHKKALRSEANRITRAPDHVNARGVLFLSDYHAGRYYGSKQKQRIKHQAIEQMLRLAADRDLDVILGGDFGDHGSNPERLESDFAAFRAIRNRVLPQIEPVFIRGNHDFGYSDQQLHDWIGGCEMHRSLVYFHFASRVAVTHGHILGLARTLEAVNEARSIAELCDMLTERALDQDLKPSVIAYDLANLIESQLASMGLSGLSPFWEGLYRYRATAAENLLNFGENVTRQDQKTWKLLASLLGSHDDLEVARQLGTFMGSWATMFGHTHESLAQRCSPIEGLEGRSAQLVGNSGNINCKTPTCLVAEFPTLTVYQYDGSADKLKKKAIASLSEIETLRYSGRFAEVASPIAS